MPQPHWSLWKIPAAAWLPPVVCAVSKICLQICLFKDVVLEELEEKYEQRDTSRHSTSIISNLFPLFPGKGGAWSCCWQQLGLRV